MKILRMFGLPVFAPEGEGAGDGEDEGAGEGDAKVLSFDFANLSPDNATMLGNKKITHESDLNEFFDMYRGLETSQGKNDMASPEDGKEADFWGEHKEKFGVGATPQDYKIDLGKMPEGMKIDEDLNAFMLNTAHKMNMPKIFVETLMTEYRDMTVAQFDKDKAALTGDVESFHGDLKTQFGDKYDGNMVLIRDAAKFLGLDDETVLLVNRLSDTPGKFVDVLLAMGNENAEGKFFENDKSVGAGNDVVALEAALVKFEEDNKDVLGTIGAAGRKEIQDKRSEMIRKLEKLKAVPVK